MNLRERVLSILNRRKPDIIPWLGDLAYWIDYLLEEDLMPEKYKEHETQKQSIMNEGLASSYIGKGLQRLHRDLGVGFYLQGYFPFKIKYDNIEINKKELNKGKEGKFQITVFNTPYGKLREIWQYSSSSYSFAPKEHLIKDWKDLKCLRYIYEHTYYEADYNLAEKRYDLIGDNGVVLCYLPKSPMMELVALKAGIENFVYFSLDVPDEFNETLKLMEKKHDEAAEIALNSPAECLMIPANISSEVVGKEYYKRYICPYHKKWVKKIREKNKYSFVHLDGTMKGLIKEISFAGFDVIEGLTPAPVGDIPIEEICEGVKEDTILWGGIPGLYFTDQITDDEFSSFVKNVLRVMKRKPRYVLGVGDQVIPGARFDRIKMVNKLVNKYGKY